MLGCWSALICSHSLLSSTGSLSPGAGSILIVSSPFLLSHTHIKIRTSTFVCPFMQTEACSHCMCKPPQSPLIPLPCQTSLSLHASQACSVFQGCCYQNPLREHRFLLSGAEKKVLFVCFLMFSYWRVLKQESFVISGDSCLCMHLPHLQVLDAVHLLCCKSDPLGFIMAYSTDHLASRYRCNFRALISGGSQEAFLTDFLCRETGL